MGMGDLRFSTIVCSSALLLSLTFSDQSNAQDQANSMLHPGNRFARQNVEIDTIAHWVGPVGVQFVGIQETEVRLAVLAEVLALGKASRTDIRIHGFSDSMFDGTVIENSTQILYLSYEPEFQKVISIGMSGSGVLGDIDFTSANSELLQIFQDGMFKQFEGCFARWNVTEKNVIKGIVIAASNELTIDQKNSCFVGLSPSAFAVSPLVSQHTIERRPTSGNAAISAIFSDRSELILELSAAAFCRLELSEYGQDCAFNLIDAILGSRRILNEQFSYK
jgi:hypothetical protein